MKFSGYLGGNPQRKHYPASPETYNPGIVPESARVGLQLATHSRNDRLLLEAWRMMAHSLMADEQYDEAIPFYRKQIECLEGLPDFQAAARSRLGYVLALTHTGKYSEALDAGLIAQNWFEQNGDEINFARISTTSAMFFIASTTMPKLTATIRRQRTSSRNSRTRLHSPKFA